MEFKVGDVVRIIDKEYEYYHNMIGLVISYNMRLDKYLVVFIAVVYDGHEYVYDDCEFPAEALELYKEE